MDLEQKMCKEMLPKGEKLASLYLVPGAFQVVSEQKSPKLLRKVKGFGKWDLHCVHFLSL